ncbi:MAG TPA: ABC transporter ATP-binding protein [Candidatus Lokiarchaeia archaeon]|nr:ABC transporter ATP-binding protein [Candidatus Lokiarchaeia archaeon]
MKEKKSGRKIRLSKYTRPYLPLLVLSVVLLFAQAYCDLSLPNYLSDIVNTGVQQHGISSAVPMAMRNSTMNYTQIFMTPANRTIVKNDYTFVAENASSTYASQYPAVTNQSIYIRNDINGTEISTLNPIMALPLVLVYGMEQLLSNSTLFQQNAAKFGIPPAQIAYLSHLPPVVLINQIFNILRTNATLVAQITSAIGKNFTALGPGLLVQAASVPIQWEYKALGINTLNIQTSYIIGVGGLMLLLTILSMICTISVGLLAARISTAMARDIRRDLFKKVQSFASAEFDSFSTASLITRSTNDITQVQNMYFMIIRLVFYAPILGFGAILLALQKSTSMWWIIAVSVLVLLIIILSVFKIALPKFQSIQKLVDRLNLVARENLSGMMVIRAFNKEEHEEVRFDTANIDLTKISRFINRLMAIMMPVMMLIMNGVSMSIIWIGAHQVAAGNLQVGDLIAFMQYTIQVVFAFLMLSIMFIILPRAAVSGGRIGQVLSAKPSILDSWFSKKFPEPFTGSVEFRNVAFRYPGAEEDAIFNVSFTAQPGETTGIIGATGSGKSTLVNLIPRFYDVRRGSIMVDGIDIRKVNEHDLRDKIGFVPQKSALFSGTIKTNLLFADEGASKGMLKSAIDISQAAEFVASKSEGMEAEISQGGKNVSGGQKQRLAIARALVKKPPIYILDDSFSALDFKTDAALRKALKTYTGGSTLLIVTQRISTIRHAEQIIVMDKGTIVGKGTHAQLMETCEMYREIAMSQLKKEELES